MELIEKSFEAPLCRGEVEVVSHASTSSESYPRVVRIQLPRMQVEHRRSNRSLMGSEIRAGQSVRINPEVGATRHGNGTAEYPPDAYRQLEDWPSWRLNDLGPRRKIRNPVSPVPDREDAGVVSETEARQFFECPQGLRRDGEIGRAVCADGCAQSFTQSALRPARLLSESIAAHFVEQVVRPSVAANLMTRLSNSFQQGGMSLRDWSQKEERAVSMMLREQIQQSSEATFEPRHGSRLHFRPNRNPIKPILDVYRERVHSSPASPHWKVRFWTKCKVPRARFRSHRPPQAGVCSIRTCFAPRREPYEVATMIIVVSPTADGTVSNATTFVHIQGAIETLKTQGGGGTVYVRKGTYTNTSGQPSLVLYDNMTLEGEGTGTVLQAAVASPLGAIRNDKSEGGGTNFSVVIRNLQINGATLATFGISLRNCFRCRVESATIASCVKDGVYMSASTEMDIVGCAITGCSRNGVAHGSGVPGRGIRVVGCTFLGCAHYGVDFEPANDSLIANCQATYGTGGPMLAGGGFVITGELAGEYLSGNRIVNCSAFDNFGPGIVVGKTSACLISSCISSRNDYGIYVSSTCVGTQVVGNQTIANKKSGIIVFRGETVAAARSVISGNTVLQNGQYGSQNAGDMTTITGNLCRGNSTETPGAAGDPAVDGLDGIRVDRCFRATVVGNVSVDSVGDQSLTADAAAGAVFVQVADIRDFYPKQRVRITGGTAEDRIVLGTSPPNQIGLTVALASSHTVSSGARVQGRPTQKYGINLYANNNIDVVGGKHVVTGNVAFANAASEIHDETVAPSASTVVNNITT